MKRCRACGGLMEDSMRFCASCGAPLDEAETVLRQAPEQTAAKAAPVKKLTGLIIGLTVLVVILAAAVAILLMKPDLPAREKNESVEETEQIPVLQWDLDAVSGTLTISGEGDMQDYDPTYELAPWSIYRGQVRTIVVEEGVLGIGDHAFEGFDQLTNVILPQSLERIGAFSFADCVGLYSVYIPAAVRQIEEAAFRGCDSLVEFNIDDRNMVYTTENGALITKNGAVFIQLPANANYTDYAVPASVVEIEAGAFFGCHKLYSVTIPGSVSEIKELTFCGCSGLTEVSIPMSVRTIWKSAFTEKVAAGGTSRSGSTNLKKIHYGGLEDWFYTMYIGEDNDNLYNAALYFVDPWDMPQNVVDYFETQILR